MFFLGRGAKYTLQGCLIVQRQVAYTGTACLAPIRSLATRTRRSEISAAQPSRFARTRSPSANNTAVNTEGGMDSRSPGTRMATAAETIAQPTISPTPEPGPSAKTAGTRASPRTPKPVDTSSKEYKRAEFRWLSIMTGLPIVFVTSYYLYDRRKLCGILGHGAVADQDDL